MNSGATPPAPTRRLVVWDPWIRLVHWAIVLLLPFSWWTAETERFQLHYLSGYAILALLIFRLAWGIVGSQTARFAGFLRSPLEGVRHLAHFRRDRRGERAQRIEERHRGDRRVAARHQQNHGLADRAAECEHERREHRRCRRGQYHFPRGLELRRA